MLLSIGQHLFKRNKGKILKFMNGITLLRVINFYSDKLLHKYIKRHMHSKDMTYGIKVFVDGNDITYKYASVPLIQHFIDTLTIFQRHFNISLTLLLTP